MLRMDSGLAGRFGGGGFEGWFALRAAEEPCPGGGFDVVFEWDSSSESLKVIKSSVSKREFDRFGVDSGERGPFRRDSSASNSFSDASIAALSSGSWSSSAPELFVPTTLFLGVLLPDSMDLVF